MADNKYTELMTNMFQSMNGFISTKTVVGDMTKVGDTVIIPLVDVSFGAGAGAGIGAEKGKTAGGIHGKMSPSAVLIVRGDGSTKLVNIKNQDAMTKILDMIPEVLDRFTKKNDEELSDEEIVESAFPDDKEDK